MRIVYMGTPSFAAQILEAMTKYENGDIIALYAQPDRQAGRGKKLHKPETKVLAESLNIPVYQPETFRNNPDAVEELRSLKPDVLVVAAYGMLLPQEVLDIPKLGAFNVHASLLPKYRGAAPVQRSLIAGDRMTGVTIMRMEAGLDTGPILLQQCMPIRNQENFCDDTQTLLERLARDGAKLMMTALDLLKDHQASYIPQNNEFATHAPKLTKQEACIDWNKTALQIHNHVRGFYPNPGATSMLHIDTKEPIAVRIEAGFYFYEHNMLEDDYANYLEHIAKLEKETLIKTGQESIKNGQFLGLYKEYIIVKAQESYYALAKIRLAGKAQMDAKAFMNGYFKNNSALYLA